MTQPPRERYEAICEGSPDAIVLTDTEGRIMYANQRVTDVFGYTPEELRGEPVEVLVPEPVRDTHISQREAYIDDPEVRPMGTNMDLEARRKDGSTIPVDISLSPLRHTDGVEVMAAIRDVSERETIRQKYQSILAAIPDAVVIVDSSTGELVEANEQVPDLWGYQPEDLVGSDLSLLSPSNETDRYRQLFDRHITEDQAIHAQFPDGSTIHIETADGERIPVEINARVFALSDRQLIVGVFRDVSARKEYERKLQELNDVTQELVAVSDRETLAQLVAEAANTILAYRSTVVRLVGDDDQLHPVGVTDRALTEMGDRPTYPLTGETPVSQAFMRDEPLVVEDVTNLNDEYERGGIHAAMYLPIHDHGVLSIVDTEVGAFDQSDVELASVLATSAKTALDRLTHERELERQIEKLDRFASVVSHDLRNPLTVAQGWVEAAQDETSSEDLKRVATALDRMESIIDDTLLLARQGQTVADRDVIDIRDLVEECWEMVTTAEAQVEIVDEFTLEGDRDRVRHVFENLFRNALDHGADDVTVIVGVLDQGGFYVADTGPGIPEEDRETIFDPGHTTSADGTGFGLAIVKEITEAHGWDVRVTQGTQGGARFEFTNVDFA